MCVHERREVYIVSRLDRSENEYALSDTPVFAYSNIITNTRDRIYTNIWNRNILVAKHEKGEVLLVCKVNNHPVERIQLQTLQAPGLDPMNYPCKWRPNI
jgi:hypothetical protein